MYCIIYAAANQCPKFRAYRILPLRGPDVHKVMTRLFVTDCCRYRSYDYDSN